MRSKILITLMFVANLIFAQEPVFNYKALITDNSGNALSNQSVNIRFTIYNDDPANGGTIEYQETHSLQTDANGIVVAEIGGGTSTGGNQIDDLNWASPFKFLKTEFDIGDGNGYQEIDTKQFYLMPYAYFAKDAFKAQQVPYGGITNKPAWLADGDNDNQTLSVNGNQLTISNGNTVTLPTGGGGDQWGSQVVQSDASLSGNGTSGSPLSVNTSSSAFNGWDKNAADDFSGNFNDLTNIPAGLSDGDDVNDADHSPTNEIQHISKSGNTVTLSNGGGSFTDAVNDADHSPTNELQTLSVNGTQLTISNGNTVTLPTGSGGDQWGSQVVQSDASLSGNGTSGSPLSVNTSSSAFNGWDKNASDDFSGNFNDLSNKPLTWKIVGGNNPSVANNDEIYRTGKVAIGNSSFVSYEKLLVENTSTSANPKLGTINKISGGGSGTDYAIYNMLSNQSTGDINGVYNSIINNKNGNHIAINNKLQLGGTGDQIGVKNDLSGDTDNNKYSILNLVSGNGNGNHYANYSLLNSTGSAKQYGAYFRLQGSGAGEQYGNYITINNTGNNLHFGNYIILEGTSDGWQIGSEHTIFTSGSGKHYGVYNDINNHGGGVHYGAFNRVLNGDGTHYGTYNLVTNGNGVHYGTYNKLSGSGTAIQYGSYQDVNTSGNLSLYGSYNHIQGSGTGNKYGSYTIIEVAAGGTHYGVYSEVLKPGSFAGYFKGDVKVTKKLKGEASGDADMKAYIYGQISSTGNIVTNKSSDGFLAQRVSTGRYKIVISDSGVTDYTVVATSYASSSPELLTFEISSQSSNVFFINSWNLQGNKQDTIFNFIVFKK